MDIEQLLKEATKDTLSEDNLNKIVEAIDLKAQELVTENTKKNDLKLESALAKQDSDYAGKLKKLLEHLDVDHTSKMKMLVEGIDKKNTKRLRQLIAKYKTSYVKESKKFKDDLVNKVDKYFDIVVEEQIPKQELTKAVENTRSRQLLEQIGKIIGMDKVNQTQIVREGIMDAKKTISKQVEELAQLKKERKELLIEKVSVYRSQLIEEKSQGLPKVKKEYLKRVLANKPIDFIKENFDYTLQFFDENENETNERLEASARSKTKVISEGIDRQIQKPEERVIVEHADQYMEGLENWGNY